MNGKDIVLDTNILLYFLNGDGNLEHFFNDYNPIISFITELELLSAPNISQNEKLLISELVQPLTVINYAESHKSDIVKIRARKKLKLPDAIIASLAITLNIPLVTAGKALKNIDELTVVFYSVPEVE